MNSAAAIKKLIIRQPISIRHDLINKHTPELFIFHLEVCVNNKTFVEVKPKLTYPLSEKHIRCFPQTLITVCSDINEVLREFIDYLNVKYKDNVLSLKCLGMINKDVTLFEDLFIEIHKCTSIDYIRSMWNHDRQSDRLITKVPRLF